MPIPMTCQCGAQITARDELSGKQIECVTCGRKMQVPQMAPPPGVPPQASMPYAPNPAQWAPVAAGAPRWPLVVSTTVSVLILVAGCVMFFVLNQKVSELQEANTQLASLEKRVQEGEKLAASVEEDRKRLQTIETSLVNATEAEKERDERVDKIEDDLEKEVAAQSEIAANLRDVEREANDLRSNISKLESDINEELAKKEEGSKDRVNKLRAELNELEDEWRKKNAELANFQVLASANKAKIRRLQSTITTIQKNPFDPTPIWAAIDALTPKYKTVVGESSNGSWCAVRFDTSSGYAVCCVRTAGSLSYRTIPQVSTATPGRYDLKMTFNSSENFYDLVLLDTETGRVWIETPLVFNPRWNRRPIFIQPGLSPPGTKHKWRIDVDASRANSTFGGAPAILVTDTENRRTYWDAGNRWAWGSLFRLL